MMNFSIWEWLAIPLHFLGAFVVYALIGEGYRFLQEFFAHLL